MEEVLGKVNEILGKLPSGSELANHANLQGENKKFRGAVLEEMTRRLVAGEKPDLDEVVGEVVVEVEGEEGKNVESNG